MAKDFGATDMEEIDATNMEKIDAFDMEEEELTEEQLMERCGTELDERKLDHLLDQFRGSACRSPILGTPKNGTVVNGYTIVAHLGTGGFGSVCLASKNDLYFAIKFMHIDDGRKEPEKEFKILHRLLKTKRHADFLTALEWTIWSNHAEDASGIKGTKKLLKKENQKLCYMVMKLAGPSLKMLLKKQRQADDSSFSIQQGVPLIKSAFKALQFYHQRRLVHYDIKIDNFAMDLHDENRVILLDYGMSSIAPHQQKKKNYFKGTRPYASRRALEGETTSYRDDCESMIYAMMEVLDDGLPWGYGPDTLAAKKDWWKSPTITNDSFLKITKHIDVLGFHETMNYDFVQNCLQEMIAEENGIPSDQYLFKLSEKKRMQVIHGNFVFCAVKKLALKSVVRLVCNIRFCNATIYVESKEYEKAEEGSPAVIVDTLNLHNCTPNS